MHELVQPAYKHTERISFITYECLSHGVSDRTTSRPRKMESRNVIQLEGNTVGTQYSYNVIQLEFNITYICHVCSRSEAGASPSVARDGLLYRREKLYNRPTFSLFSSNSHRLEQQTLNITTIIITITTTSNKAATRRINHALYQHRPHQHCRPCRGLARQL
jgi:hypothetical protein